MFFISLSDLADELARSYAMITIASTPYRREKKPHRKGAASPTGRITKVRQAPLPFHSGMEKLRMYFDEAGFWWVVTWTMIFSSAVAARITGSRNICC
jgi:hypothetical protein